MRRDFTPHGAAPMSKREFTVSGSEALKVADALNSTTYRILQLISDMPLDVSTIAEKLDLSEAYVSEQIRELEDLKLIHVSYGRGKRGIRKICSLAVDRVTIIIKP
jgi:predicted transcriptional regulator